MAAVTTQIPAQQAQQVIQDLIFAANPLQDPRNVGEASQLRNLRAQVQSGISNSSTDDRAYSLNRWNTLIAGMGMFAGLASAAFTGYMALRSQNNSTGPTVPAGVNTPLINKLMAQWTSLDDTDFWNALASYVESNTTSGTELTLADQYQFMTYVMDLWPLTTPWIWQQGSDQIAARDFFVAKYADNDNSTAAMYQAVTTYQCEGNALPRSVAAQVLQWALAQIIVNSATSQDAPLSSSRKRSAADTATAS
jgi:hypothetical protein